MGNQSCEMASRGNQLVALPRPGKVALSNGIIPGEVANNAYADSFEAAYVNEHANHGLLQMALVRPDIRDPALNQVAISSADRGGLDKHGIEALDAEIIRMNPDCKQYPEGVCGRVELNADGSLHTYDLHGKRLTQLPDAICRIKATGNLDLGNNHLEHLPANFGSIAVDGNLWLNNNWLADLPRGFGNITVGKSLVLDQAFSNGVNTPAVKPPAVDHADFPNVKYLLHPNVYMSEDPPMREMEEGWKVGRGPGLPGTDGQYPDFVTADATARLAKKNGPLPFGK